MPSQESSGSRKRPRSPREDKEKMDAEDEFMATNITAKVGSTPQIEKIFYRKQNDGHFVQTCATPSNPQSVSTHQYVTKSSWSSRGTCNMRVCLPSSLPEESRRLFGQSLDDLRKHQAETLTRLCSISHTPSWNICTISLSPWLSLMLATTRWKSCKARFWESSLTWL